MANDAPTKMVHDQVAMTDGKNNIPVDARNVAYLESIGWQRIVPGSDPVPGSVSSEDYEELARKYRELAETIEAPKTDDSEKAADNEKDSPAEPSTDEAAALAAAAAAATPASARTPKGR